MKQKLKSSHYFLIGIFYTIITTIIWYQFIQVSLAYFEPILIQKIVTVEVEKQTIIEIEKEMTVKEKIVYYANIFDVNPDTALRIAECESQFNPNAENVNGSATGIYQFIRKTWKANCRGDVYNADDNIICFMENYPQHKSWWECK